MFEEKIRKDTREANSPLVFWGYCADQRAAITNMAEKNLFQLQGHNDHMATFGNQGDISNICQFVWNEWFYAIGGSEPFPHMAEVLGRCLGPTKNKGKKMTQWVLNINGKIVPRRSLRLLRPNELSSDVEISNRDSFDA